MRSHIQGLFLLLIVGIALLGMVGYAAPVVKEALGEDGALQAESAPEDATDLAATEAVAAIENVFSNDACSA